MNVQDKIDRLKEFRANLYEWNNSADAETRSYINQNLSWIRREVLEAGRLHTFTVAPPPAVGGLIVRNLDPFSMIFSPPYEINLIPSIVDMIDQTIGVLQEPPGENSEKVRVEIDPDVSKGYAFIAMPIDPANAALEDVLDAIKEAASRCGIHAERVDEPQSNDRITDRILESIRKAEYVIVDLTDGRPSVFYEAGYAQGLRKTPIYIAREGTHLEFDLKDYPVIFFRSMKQLKDALELRLRGVASAAAEKSRQKKIGV
ncbi:MAG TPA: hypothetical protein VN380_22085 [Thermoanaerobaculia bacterium]|jgi:hypothetical protein|nr:hypothetical protein [Thermoanaerobaculia bacterium]